MCVTWPAQCWAAGAEVTLREFTTQWDRERERDVNFDRDMHRML